MTEQPHYPYRDGDVAVLGPQVIASADGMTISWQGANYRRDNGPVASQAAEPRLTVGAITSDQLAALDGRGPEETGTTQPGPAAPAGPTDEDILVAIESALEAQLLPLPGVAVLDRTRTAVLNAIGSLIAQLRRDRDLAIAHDRQPYPTAWAYEQACAALYSHQARADEAEQQRDELAAALREALAAFHTVRDDFTRTVVGYTSAPIHPTDMDRWRTALEQPKERARV